MAMKTMRARFAGTCKGCDCRIRKGELIQWSKKTGAYHFNCVPSSDSKADAEYYAGRADGERYLTNKAVYGAELAEQWEMEEELARFNRGDDW